jgi:hypothetical protein
MCHERRVIWEGGAMGIASQLMTWVRVKRMSDPVRGTLKITVCAQPETAIGSASYSALVLGVVQGPGIEPTAVEHSCTVWAKRCPRSGQSVPVTVDRADPSRIAILWDEVPLRDPLGNARSATRSAAAAARSRNRHLP